MDTFQVCNWFYKRLLSIFSYSHVGRAHNIVVAERVVLNFMQRMSGIATLTKVFFFKAKFSLVLLDLSK